MVVVAYGFVMLAGTASTHVGLERPTMLCIGIVDRIEKAASNGHGPARGCRLSGGVMKTIGTQLTRIPAFRLLLYGHGKSSFAEFRR